jgi:hypothetical protein
MSKKSDETDIPPPIVVETDEMTLRSKFIIGDFEARLERGELSLRVMPGTEHPAPQAMIQPLGGEPAGTLAHMLQIFDGPRLVALVHEYLRPDGSRGASGKRDPKWLLLDGVVYKQAKKRARGRPLD